MATIDLTDAQVLASAAALQTPRVTFYVADAASSTPGEIWAQVEVGPMRCRDVRAADAVPAGDMEKLAALVMRMLVEASGK